MRFRLRASAALAALALSVPAAAQTRTEPAPIDSIGTVVSADAIRDLPLGDNVYALLETTQPEVISDRFNSGGLNVGGDARVGGFLGSWSQTRFRIGDVDVSDPTGSGASLLFPDTLFWDAVHVTTGLMPADLNTPGLAVGLQPRRAGSAWSRTVEGAGSGGSLVAGAPADTPIPIVRLADFAHASALVSGPVSSRTGLVAGGTWSRGSSYTREVRPSTDSSIGSGFAHIVFTPSADRELRVLGIAQRSDRPFDNWRLFQDPLASSNTTAVHVQSTFEHHAPDTAQWRVFAGLTSRSRTNDVGSTGILLDRIVDGPVAPLVDSAADTTARRITIGARLEPYRSTGSVHHFAFGADLDAAHVKTSDAFGGTVREFVDDVPARLWRYAAPGTASNRSVTTAAVHASDLLSLSPSLTLDAALRAEVVHGAADGAATAVTWFSVLPHAYVRWALSDRRRMVFGYGRSANALTTNWLAFGDPAASVASVAAASATGVVVSRVGPGTGGSPSFSAIDDNVKRPYTDEFVIGFEKRRSSRTRYTLTGIARREAQLLGVVDTEAPASSYATIGIPDAGKDLVDPSDDRTLVIYDRLPSTFGQDAYVLTNPGQEAATAFALRMTWEHSGDRLFTLFGATASAAQGSGGNRGYGPLENDQDIPGELGTNPNAATYARGRLFSDRAFTIKWSGLYRFPHDFTIGAIARYQDGQPFSRLVIAPTLNQGAEAIQAYPNAGSRFTFTGTLDLRVQKGFRVGSSRIDAILDAYNLLTRNNEVEEYVVSGPAFRTPTAIEPPPAVHIGLRVSF
jgi:hypothetical protein